ncbi:DUF943 family protein [Brenneria goodwinii]|uniref:DUF943 family protein n=1 Tax=Brenneria goodwinii TaxID=1109412 RepID=UPI0036F1974A
MIAVLAVLTAVYGIIGLARPVKIVAVHQKQHFSHVPVLNFPLTDRGKIDWWLKNREMLKEKYAIPKRSSYGSFTITFWDFGEGYKEAGKYYRRCFEDMQTKKNCVEKQLLFSINDNGAGSITLRTSNQRYRLQPDGEIVPYESRVHMVR